MKIYIPTRGRINEQRTWGLLSDKAREHVTLVCPPDEVKYHDKRGRRTLARPVNGLSNVIQWLWDSHREQLLNNEHSDPYLMIMDDDLKIATWGPRPWRGVKPHLRPAEPDEIDQMFADLEQQLQAGFPMVGVSPRAFNDSRFPRPYKDVIRQMQLHAYDIPFMFEHNISANTTPIMQDFHITLSVLEAGAQNRILNYFTVDQAMGSGAKGGCAIYRTLDLMKETAFKLQELHPKAVTPVQKKSANWKFDGEMRWDVDIAWKAAYTGTKEIEE